MKMGSASLTVSGSSSSSGSSESLKGLKFGQKIYFEDVGLGAPSKSGGGASSAGGSSGNGASSPAKRVKGVVQGNQPPRCQVEGCKVDLSDAKAYYSRHKVCGMHSKSPKVIVAGMEQRFCQQCSRFHQLPEFDQGKRSCRRRLAGHNERRRKPPPGSLLSSRYGRTSSSLFETSNRGGFLMDFSAYPRLQGREPWPTTRLSERSPSNQSTHAGRYLPHPWHTDANNPPPSDLFLQSGTGFLNPGIPPGECITGVSVSDSGCALSLLSNQSWAPNNRNRPMVNNLMNADGSHVTTQNHHLPATSWGFRAATNSGGSSHEMPPDLGLGQITQPMNIQFSGELDVANQQSGRQYLAYDAASTQQMNWSL